MNRRRRRVLALAAGLVTAPAVLRLSGAARAGEVTLRLHHFLPATANAHKLLLAPWAERLAQESGGRLTVQIFPAMQLGGTPAELFDQVRDGTVDIAWTLPGNTPGRFPRLEVFELPFVASATARVNARAVQAFADTHAAAELAEVRPLCAWAHDQGIIHSRRLVRTRADLQGLRLRFPTPQSGAALRALGAGAVQMPITQVPEALARGAIDGAVVPWEVVPTLGLQELVASHTAIPGTPTLYTTTFLLVMNRARYDDLPDDLQAVIDANSGMRLATRAGEIWDRTAIPARQRALDRGNTLYTLDSEEARRWQAACRPVVDAWIAQADAAGLDGAGLLAEARALLARQSTAQVRL